MRTPLIQLVLAATIGVLIAPSALAQQCPPSVPVQGAPVSGPLPVFPADNW